MSLLTSPSLALTKTLNCATALRIQCALPALCTVSGSAPTREALAERDLEDPRLAIPLAELQESALLRLARKHARAAVAAIGGTDPPIVPGPAPPTVLVPLPEPEVWEGLRAAVEGQCQGAAE